MYYDCDYRNANSDSITDVTILSVCECVCLCWSLEDTPVQKLHFISMLCTENRLEKEKQTNEKSHPWLALGGLIRSSFRDMWWRSNFKWRNWFQPPFLTLSRQQWYTYTCWYDIYHHIYDEAAWAIESTYKYIPGARSAPISRAMYKIPHTARHIINWMEPPSLTHVGVQAWACFWAYGFGTWLLCACDSFFLFAFFPFPNFYIGGKFSNNGLFFMSYDIFLLRFLHRFMFVRLDRFRR